MGIYSILNIARGALSASQTSVQVTSNNIANVNTTGYAKESADLEEATPVPTSFGTLGDGVTVKTVTRAYDKFLDGAIQNATSDSQKQSVLSTYLNRIQGFFDESNSGLTGSITTFFNDWQSLSADPTNTGIKQSLASQGQALAQSISTIYTNIKGVQQQADQQLTSDVDSVNGMLSSIASLNKAILGSGGTSGEANSYMDQKAQLLSDLSQKININTMQDEYGRTTILTSGGKALVEGDNAATLSTIPDMSTGYSKVAIKDAGGTVTDITGDITGGEMKGLIDTRDTYAPGFIDKLDSLSSTIIDNVKWRLNGAASDTSFFQGTDASTIAVSTAIVNDPTGIPATSDPVNNPTDNDIAVAMAGLADQKLMDGGTSTLADFSAATIDSAGQVTKDAQSAAQFSQATMTTLQQQQASTSGVSIDEEMTNLIKFQFAYQAASRLLNVASDLLADLMGVIK